MGDIPTQEILKTIRQYRNEKSQKPEVTIEAEPGAARAQSGRRRVDDDFGHGNGKGGGRRSEEVIHGSCSEEPD
jgi:hypothetical protein